MDRLREEEQVELGGTSPIRKIPLGKGARPHATRMSRFLLQSAAPVGNIRCTIVPWCGHQSLERSSRNRMPSPVTSEASLFHL